MSSFDLGQRTLEFALRVDQYILKLPKNIPNIEHSKQLTRSAGAVGANYIEGNEALGPKDYIMRLRISRKEAKESNYWLLLTLPVPAQEGEKAELIQESSELVKIISSIINKAKN